LRLLIVTGKKEGLIETANALTMTVQRSRKTGLSIRRKKRNYRDSY